MDKNIINQRTTKAETKLKLKIVNGLMENIEALSLDVINDVLYTLVHGFGLSVDTVLNILNVSVHIGTLSEEKFKAILEGLD